MSAIVAFIKKNKKKDEQRIKSLTTRWLVDIISIVAIVLVIVQIIASIVIYNYYYDTVRQDVLSKMSISSDVLTTIDSKSDYEFEQAAKQFLSDYFEKKSLEVQIFDRFGNIIASSQGFLPENTEFEDYEEAKQNYGQYREWKGENASGESVMAISTVLPATNSVSLGAIRFVVSMDEINSTIFSSIILVFGCCMAALAVVVLSGTLFLRSILIPIRAITDTAFKIASGDLDTRLPVPDQSEVGKLCDTINYMATELQSAEKVKNDFISSVSHELRTPLTAIKGWGETVKASIGYDDKITQKGVNIMVNETERLSGLVEDLLDFSRLQSGRLKIKKEKIDLLAELDEAVYMYENIAAKRNITLTYNEPLTFSPIMADSGRIKQVFINIIDNAVKYSNAGDTVSVNAVQKDVYIEVKISDTGCGIAAQDLSKVKEKFYKANTNVKGSGIGLAMADEIIKQHNGILEVDSKEGQGTTVTICLPFIKQNKLSNKEGKKNFEQK